MSCLYHRVFLLAGILSIAAPIQAQKIGEVQNRQLPAQIKVGDNWGNATNKDEITPASELRTGDGGSLSGFLFDSSFPESRRQLEMLSRSHVRILEWVVLGEPARDHVKVALDEGDLRWIGDASDIQTGPGATTHVVVREVDDTAPAGPGCAAAEGIAEIFVSYTPDTGRVEVTAANGAVTVRNPAGEIDIQAHEVAIVERGSRPHKAKRRVGADELDDLRGQFQFIGGGRAQSQAVNSSLANGKTLDRAGRKAAPQVDPLKNLPIHQPTITVGLGIDF